MNVVYFFQNKNSAPPQKQNIAFEAGLTPKIMQEIQKADVLEISDRLAKKGIPTDFKGDKVIAWCCSKTIEILETINKKYNLKLEQPKGIYVKDFRDLNMDDHLATGLCNSTQTFLVRDSNKTTPPKTLFFNSFDAVPNKFSEENKYLYSWGAINIDKAADRNYETKFRSTNLFLERFLHEFSHVLHESKLQYTVGGDALAQQIRLFKDPQRVNKYQQKYRHKLAQVCDYALTNPFDAIACDLSKVIADSLDKETLMPTKNPFIGTPYEDLSFWQRVNLPTHDKNEELSLHEILRNFWNGKFE